MYKANVIALWMSVVADDKCESILILPFQGDGYQAASESGPDLRLLPAIHPNQLLSISSKVFLVTIFKLPSNLSDCFSNYVLGSSQNLFKCDLFLLGWE